MAATLRLLSAGSIRRGVTGVIGLVEDAGHARVSADFTSAPKVKARVLAGEQADVIIASTSALDALEENSRIVSASRAVVGRTGMAIAVREGTVMPDLSTKAAFRQAMLESDLVIYNQGSSGIHAASLIDRLDLRQALGSRIRIAQNGAEMFELITSTPGRAVGLANITNILDQIAKGAPVALAALLPDEIQNVTTYEVAVAAGAEHPALAEVFVRMFASAEGRKQLAIAGVQQD